MEVLADAGAEIAATKLAAMPLEQIVAGLAHHVDVYDVAAVSSYETTDGEIWDYSRPVRDRVGCEIGGFHVAARREDSWDAIITVLVALDTDHPERFVDLMRAVRSRSHSLRERDGFHALLQNRDQMMFDVAAERERRRQQRGFASPADARAFLVMSRSVRRDAIRPNPIAREYARSIEMSPPDEQHDTAATAEEMHEVVELLAGAGVTPLQPPRALLESGAPESTSRMQRLLQHAFERDQAAYGDRNFELAYLANVLIAGCSIQSRPFTTKEAADAAAAICELGVGQLPDAPADYFITNDLIGVFQLGWASLYRDVTVPAASQLADTLEHIRIEDADTQSALNMLRIRLLRALDDGEPWRAAGALDVLMAIDLPAWAALVALIAECPVIHAGLIASIDRTVRTVDPNAFEYIARPDQLALVRTFLNALPGVLSA